MAFVQEKHDNPFDEVTAERMQLEPAYHLSPMNAPNSPQPSSPSHMTQHHHVHRADYHVRSDSNNNNNNYNNNYNNYNNNDEENDLFGSMSPSTPTTVSPKISRIHEQVAAIHMENMAALDEVTLEESDYHHHHHRHQNGSGGSSLKMMKKPLSPQQQQKHYSTIALSPVDDDNHHHHKHQKHVNHHHQQQQQDASDSKGTYGFFDYRGSLFSQRPFEIVRRFSPILSGVLATIALGLSVPGLVLLTPYRDGVMQFNGSDFLYESFRFHPMYLLLPSLLFICVIVSYLSWLLSGAALKHENTVASWNSGSPVTLKKWRHTRTNAFPLAKLIPLFIAHVFVVLFIFYSLVCLVSSIDSKRSFEKSDKVTGLCKVSSRTCTRVKNGFGFIMASSIIAIAAMIPLLLMNSVSTSLTAHRKRPRAFRYNADGTPCSEEEIEEMMEDEATASTHHHNQAADDDHTDRDFINEEQ